jgi:formylglycine-generating enzyme required for sulfatase activity
MKNDWNLKKDITDNPPSTIISPLDGAEMVFVPEGPFIMGLNKEELIEVFDLESYENPIFLTEYPAQEVYLPSYYIDRYPVTNYQYKKFMEATGHPKPLLMDDPLWNKPMQPVVYVGWDDARAYSAWAGKELPSEAQWEKAGRGSDRRTWAWGHEFALGNCNSREEGLGRTSEVGQYYKGISPYGCYDMCGNVWEMCEGVWLEDRPPMRGGCFLGTASFVRITCRWSPEHSSTGAHWMGFRTVKELYPI